MTTLAKLLLDFALRIGKAIVRRLAKWTVRRVVTWMRKRIAVFRERWERADTTRRRKWLAGRIARWSHAANWIEAKALATLREAACEVRKLPAFRKAPEWATHELRCA